MTAYTEACMMGGRMPIRVLEQTVASQIAAGEVVERPASVVKELVENSLDAGASEVSVEAREGGVGLIRVSDNGCGIPAEELPLAFSRYATSKVSSIADLESMTTLGFRGEALPSIAAVAEVQVVTRTAGEPSGHWLRLREGAVVGQGRQGRSRGTTVAVRHLFRALPARLKFLKSAATENGHIARVVSDYALAFPEVRFALSIDGRTALRTPGSGRLLDSVIEVHGAEVARELLQVGTAEETWPVADRPSVTGMVSPPRLSRANREHLKFFVNRRSINSRTLAWAVEEAYHGLLMAGRHPVAILNISLPPEEVDVNIHPTKAEVKFRNERAVFAAVQKAVRATLVNLAPVARIEEPTAIYQAPATRPLWTPAGPAEAVPAAAAEPAPVAASLPPLRVLGQLAASYVVAEGPDGLYVIDQHAAHERILYQRFRRQQRERRVDVQGLLEPVPFEVTPKQEEVLREGLPHLAEAGFAIEPFGERTYLVRSVPALLSGRNWPAMVRELLEAPGNGDTADWMERVAVSLACHGAVVAGQALSEREMRQLIRELEGAGLPSTCPHGRPAVLHLSSRHLERQFGRG